MSSLGGVVDFPKSKPQGGQKVPGDRHAVSLNIWTSAVLVFAQDVVYEDLLLGNSTIVWASKPLGQDALGRGPRTDVVRPGSR